MKRLNDHNAGTYGKNVAKCFFSETTWTIESKLSRNDHWNVLYQGTIFYVDRKSKIKLSPAVATILNFISEQKTLRL
jgi:hypothetical protein